MIYILRTLWLIGWIIIIPIVLFSFAISLTIIIPIYLTILYILRGSGDPYDTSDKLNPMYYSAGFIYWYQDLGDLIEEKFNKKNNQDAI